MADPEAWLRATTAPLARAREGSPYPVARLSVEAVANAFVVLGLLPAARAEEILAAQRPVLEAAGFRVGREIGELSINPGARSFREARAAVLDSPRQIPLAVAAGPARLPLRRHDLVITWATLTPEGIRLCYRGGARIGDRDVARALVREITEDITELSITDGTGRTYRVPAANVPGTISGQRSASGETRWIPEGEVLAIPVRGEAGSRGGGPAIRWLELSAESGPPVRVKIPSAAEVPTGTTEPPWPTPAECYLDQLAPPDHDWSVGSFETGTVELDAAAIVAAVADALVAVGALPPDSAVLTGVTDRVHPDWHLALSDRQRALMGPCFRVTAVDDTGAEHEGGPDHGTASAGHEGSGVFWFWPPVSPQARQLRVTVSTLWEAAWALVDIPGR